MTVTDLPSRSAVDVVQHHWNCTTTGDAEGLRPIVADDAVFHYPGQHPISGDYRGKDEVVALYARLWRFATKGSFVPVLHELIPGEEFVAVVLSYRMTFFRDRGIPGRATGLLRVRDGQIHEFWLFEWDQSMINDVFRTMGVQIALREQGPLAALPLLPRAIPAAIRTMRRVLGPYSAPTDV